MNWNSLELGDVLLKILNSKKDFIEHKKQKNPLKNLIKHVSDGIHLIFMKLYLINLIFKLLQN